MILITHRSKSYTYGEVAFIAPFCAGCSKAALIIRGKLMANETQSAVDSALNGIIGFETAQCHLRSCNLVTMDTNRSKFSVGKD